MGLRRSILGALFMLSALAVWGNGARDYYPSELQGKKGAELKTYLHNLLKDHERISYGGNGTWVVFRKSDVRPNGSVWDMYSNTKRYFSGASGAVRGMNIEHSVPKSWWGDAYPYTVDCSFDLHHLTPSDESANMAKSNYVLGEVTSTSFENGVIKVGTAYIDKRSINAFEPADEYKGDFARMYMYVVTCYQDYTWRSAGVTMFTSNTYPTLTDYGRELLLKWHRQDPVSQKETDRNNAVYDAQGNRNPFIDYPELSEHIWGNKTGEAFYFSDRPYLETPQTGDDVVFAGTSLNGNRIITLLLRGKNIGNALKMSVSGTDAASFTVPATVSGPDVNSEAGARVEIAYRPKSYGMHAATLTVGKEELGVPVVLSLKGLCEPAETGFITIPGLKSKYSTGDAKVALTIIPSLDGGKWFIGNQEIPASGGQYYFDPAAAGKGTHTIVCKSDGFKVQVRVEVE